MVAKNNSNKKTFIAFDQTLEEMREHGLCGGIFTFTNDTVECVTKGIEECLNDNSERLEGEEARNEWSVFELTAKGDLFYKGTVKKAGIQFIAKGK